jgi:hypothetical protein
MKCTKNRLAPSSLFLSLASSWRHHLFHLPTPFCPSPAFSFFHQREFKLRVFALPKNIRFVSDSSYHFHSLRRFLKRKQGPPITTGTSGSSSRSLFVCNQFAALLHLFSPLQTTAASLSVILPTPLFVSKTILISNFN